MATYTEDYDPGFLNVPGFGQSSTNPLAPVFYKSLGVTEDHSVYRNFYCSKTVHAGEAYVLGDSYFQSSGFLVEPPGIFRRPVVFEKDVSFQTNITVGNITYTKRLFVNGIEFRPKAINTISGTHLVLAAV